MNRECNPAGRKLIEGFEKFSPIPYQDQRGIWTQGFGHTLGITSTSPEITLAQADLWLEGDLAVAERTINRLVDAKSMAELTDNEFSALCAFVFNIGSGNFKGSTTLHQVNAGYYDDVPAAMMMFDEVHDPATGKLEVSQGLVNRRNAEIVLWKSKDGLDQETA